MPNDLSNSPVPLAEISQAPNSFEQFLDRNHKNLIVFAILIALGGVALVIYRGIDKGNEQSAGAAVVGAKDIAALQKVADQYPKTTAVGSALLLLGNKQWEEGQQDAGIATLQKLIAEHPEHAAIPGAQASLAAKLVSQGKIDEATKLFESLSTNPNAKYIAPYALISLGDLAKSRGEAEKSNEFYTKVTNMFPNSPFGQAASSRIANAKAKAPLEIEPPPAPAAPAADSPPAPPAPVIAPEPAVIPEAEVTPEPVVEPELPTAPAESAPAQP